MVGDGETTSSTYASPYLLLDHHHNNPPRSYIFSSKKMSQETSKTDANAMATASGKKARDGGRGEEKQYDDDNDDDLEEEFVFTDQVHQQQEFQHFYDSLVNFGLVDEDLLSVDKDKDGREEEDQTNDGSGGGGGDGQTADTEKDDDKGTTAATTLDRVSFARSARSSSYRSFRDRRKSKLVAYKKGQTESFLAVLDEIDRIGEAQTSKGLVDTNFTFGLLNCLAIAYAFGRFPQHFWILYIVECSFWMGWKFRRMIHAKPLSEVLYYLDFCWVMNTAGVCLLCLFVLLGNERIDMHATIIPTEVRKSIFLAAFGIFVGPVFLASMALPFVAFLFHDVNTMANLTIHLMPSLAMYHLRWHAKELHDAYPTFFNVQYLNDMKLQDEAVVTKPTRHDDGAPPTGDLPFWNGFGHQSVAWNAMVVYFMWWIPYTLWMLCVGLKLPVTSKDPTTSRPPKYDTVFHSLWRDGPCELVGRLLWKRPGEISRDQSSRNDFDVRDFMFYMCGHAFACLSIGIGVIAGISYVGGRTAHLSMIMLSTLLCAQRGASRYTYYSVTMYGQKLRKAFKEHQANEISGDDSQGLDAVIEAAIAEDDENFQNKKTK